MSKREVISGLCIPFGMAAAVLAWPLWVVAGIGWAIARCFRPEGVKVTERNRAKVAANQRAHRIQTAIQMQLAAQGLPNTPANRALVAVALNRKGR